MCGFFISQHPQVNKSHFLLIEKRLHFRGPDFSSGVLKINGWLVYHARLSIIGLSPKANQPYIGKNKGVLVFNGEILNYKELGESLLKKSYDSDTEVLCDLIENNLLDLDQLDGFFSFVYVDSSGELKYACRDKFGVKPLYHYKDSKGIAFSSEPALLAAIFDLKVNQLAIEEYRSVRSPVFSGSFFSGVNSVDPGTCLINGVYFNCLSAFDGYKPVLLGSLKKALQKGVSSRMVSDAKVGLLLSRGVDSNLIHSLGNFDKIYSIGFSGDEDIAYLKGQDIENLTIHECTPEEYRESFEYLLQLRGEPMSVPNEVLLYKIASIAAQDGVKVLLSGEGADEFFAGYDRVFNWAAKQEMMDLDKFLELYCYSSPSKDSPCYQKFKELFEKLSHLPVFEQVRYFFIRFHMPVLFRRLDFSLMAAGVEGREPIANTHLFELALLFSKDLLLNGVLGKLPLREIISEFKGETFAYEKKVGFPVDLRKVFENSKNLSSYELWFEKNLEVFS